MALSALDRERLREALALAERSIGVSEPNPRVGCVIGHTDGRVIGRGWTQAIGGPHAEVVALRGAQAAGHDPRDATAWVTLEPCAHHGRTPPCADALVEAGIARVVVAIGDPFPQVAGEGIARLRAAGVAVDLADADGDIAQAARELNIGFFSRVERGRPWVRLKIAASLDGRTALPDGRSQWITGEAARADGHAWRRRAGAVLTGIGTVLADDPRLDVRLVPTTVQPLRVVLDSHGRTPAGARVLAPPGRALLIVTAGTVASETDASADTPGGTDAIERLAVAAGPDGRPDLTAVLAALGARGINELHVEAGAVLNGALLGAGLADEVLLYQAPVWLGAGRAAAELAPPTDLARALRGQFVAVDWVGTDLRLRWRP